MVETRKHIASKGKYQYAYWDGMQTVDMDAILPELVRNFADKTYRNVKFTQGHQGGWIDQNPELVLGTVESLIEDGGKLLADIKMSEKAEKLISEGKLTDVSIGFFTEYVDNQGISRGATLFEVALVGEGFLATDPFQIAEKTVDGVTFSQSSADSNFRKGNLVYFSVNLAKELVEEVKEAETKPLEAVEIANEVNTQIEQVEPITEQITGADSKEEVKKEVEAITEVTEEPKADDKITIEVEQPKKEEVLEVKETEVKEPVKFTSRNDSFDRVEFARLKREEFNRKVEDFANSFLLSRGGKLTEKFYNPIVELSKVVDQTNWSLITKLLDQVDTKFTAKALDAPSVDENTNGKSEQSLESKIADKYGIKMSEAHGMISAMAQRLKITLEEAKINLLNK